MGQLVDQDVEHLRLLKIGYYVHAGLMAFFTLFGLMYVMIGGAVVSAIVQQAPRSSGSDVDPKIVGMIFAGLGFFFLIFGIGATLLNYLAGKGLEQRNRRVLILIAAVLSLLSVPWGTLLGVFTFMVLNRDSVRPLFAGGGMPMYQAPLPPPAGPGVPPPPAWRG